MQSSLLLLDTGAHLSLTQCEPCERCYRQKSDVYNSYSSTSFQPIDCTHPLCSDVLKCASRRLCTYSIAYGGSPRTSRFAMTETLTFVTDDQHLMVLNKIVMGCSKNSQNFRFGPTGDIGGIMVLSPSRPTFFGKSIRLYHPQIVLILLEFRFMVLFVSEIW